MIDREPLPTNGPEYHEDHAAWVRRQPKPPVSQPWDAGSDADRIVTMYVSDANGTTLALVELGKVPLDGTWEVMHATATGAIEWNRATVGQYHGGAWMDSMLVVARPVGSGE